MDRWAVGERPWTVRAMIVLALGRLAWRLLFDGFELMDLAWIPIDLALTYLLWMGRRWVYSLSFVLTVVAACISALIVAAQATLAEFAVAWNVVAMLGLSVVWIFLLQHPATKRFIEDNLARVQPTSTTA